MNKPVLNELFYDNSAVMLVIDPHNGNIIDANRAAEKFYGYSEKEFSSMNIGDINILPAKDIRKQLTGVKNKKIFSPQYRHQLKNGSIRDIKALVSTFRLNRRPVNFAIIQDITNEAAYRDELAKFKSIADNSMAMIGIAGNNRQVLYLNKKMRQVFGIAADADITAFKIYDFYSPRGKKMVHALINKIVKKGHWQGENEMQPPGGSIIPVLQTVTVIKDAGGKPLFTSMMAVDISMEKNAEKRVAESESQLKQAELIGNTGNLVFNMRTGLYSLSEGARKIYGINKKTVTLKDITSLRTEGQSAKLDAALEKIKSTGKPVELVYQIKRKSDHKEIDLQVKAQYMPGMDVIISTLKDITEQTSRENEIIELNRELRNLNNYLQRVRLEERNAFAKEVHDKIGQKLVMLKLQAEQIRKTLHTPAGNAGEGLDTLSGNISAVLHDFQKIYSDVKTVVLTHLGLSDAIYEMGVFFTTNSSIALEYYSNAEQDGFDSIIRNTLLLCTEQCLDNIVRHAAASVINMELVKKRKKLILTIKDNGRGFNYTKIKMNRYGLLQVRELLNSVGGKLTIHSKPGAGTTIQIAVPFA